MLLDKFEALIERLVGRDKALDNDTSEDVYLADNALVFTIRGLYRLMCKADDISYIEFRTALYQGNLNQELGKIGYEVTISESTGNIDTSWYQLRPVEVV